MKKIYLWPYYSILGLLFLFVSCSKQVEYPLSRLNHSNCKSINGSHSDPKFDVESNNNMAFIESKSEKLISIKDKKIPLLILSQDDEKVYASINTNELSPQNIEIKKQTTELDTSELDLNKSFYGKKDGKYFKGFYLEEEAIEKEKKTSGKFISSMILGIIGFLLIVPSIYYTLKANDNAVKSYGSVSAAFGILALIFGSTGLNKAKLMEKGIKGRGMAIAGFVLGVLFASCAITLLILAL